VFFGVLLVSFSLFRLGIVKAPLFSLFPTIIYKGLIIKIIETILFF